MNTNPTSPDLPVAAFVDTDRRERLYAACPELETIFRRYAEGQPMPGVSYGVVIDGELIFTHAFGLRNVADHAPVTTETVFRIASMTKSFAALAIMQLRNRGRLCLDEPAATYVPELATLTYPTVDSSPITVRDLLTMSAGWPQDDPWADRQLYRTDEELSTFYRAGVAWSNPPRQTFEYSNYGYMVLGRIITNVAGLPAIDYITQEILQPLGMNATVWNATDVAAERLAQGYRWEDAMWKAEPMLPTGGDVAAFAGLFTSVPDLARWVALFQGAWPPRDDTKGTLLRHSSLREMQQIGRATTPSITLSHLGAAPLLQSGGYGYGLSISHNGQVETVGHGGGLPGFGSHMRWAPAYGIGVIVLANVTYARVHAACSEALQRLIAVSKVEPRRVPVAPALASARADILKLLTEWDDELAADLFADNFFLDLDRTHHLQELAEVKAQLGALQPDGPFVVENWLRGHWRMQGERGWCKVFITLAPTVPPRVQTLRLEITVQPSSVLQRLAKALADLTAQPLQDELAHLCAPDLDLAPLWDQVRLAHILCGPCTVDKVEAGDGSTWATFRLTGPKANVLLTLRVNAQGQLTEATFR
ncbi:MAG: serine hydrolase domain-containing protein [Caldilineaceae bacterium]